MDSQYCVRLLSEVAGDSKAGRRTAPVVTLSEVERAELRTLAGRRKTAQAMAMRARIVLACAEGLQSKQVAAKLGLDEATVGKWANGAGASPRGAWPALMTSALKP